MHGLTSTELRKMVRSASTAQIASRQTDPRFYAGLNFLPNPDVILRKANRSEEVFEAIMSDAHVMGELRSVRSGLLSYEWKLIAGGDDPTSARAMELCQMVMDKRPAPGMSWSDTIWNMGEAAFRGYRVHEVVWRKEGDLLMPDQIFDVPNRRCVFDPDNNLRVITRSNMLEGEETDLPNFLITRHMPSWDNPYGRALFSSCFWPYTFKHAGFKWFVKFCERIGIPIPVGKYPAGSSDADIDRLEKHLAELIEAGYMAMQDGGSIGLLEAKVQANRLPQHELIRECDRQMSKALTSQTLATEIEGGGSRAAAETHRERETSVNESDRIIIEQTINQLFEWITLFNVGADAKPPTFAFYEEQEVRKDKAEVYAIAAGISDSVSKKGMHEDLNIAMSVGDDDRLLPPPGSPRAQNKVPEFSAGRCPKCGPGADFRANDPDAVAIASDQADQIIAADFIDVIAAKLAELEAEGKDMKDFQAWLVGAYPDLDDSALTDLTAKAMTLEYLRGMDQVAS